MTTDITPSDLADLISATLGRALLAFDVDGVLAPIVEHADDAALSPGISDHLDALCRVTEVAILSGRSLESLERLFAFSDRIHVIGSHGLEERGEPPMSLDPAEAARFASLVEVGDRAVATGGDGAWLESKPASVVVHTRAADTGAGERALAQAAAEAAAVEGAVVKAGHMVVELLARSTSKGVALLALADRLTRAPIVYLGDDLTDEDAFAMMGGDDISIRVGDGPTAARYRLPGPEAVRQLVTALSGG